MRRTTQAYTAAMALRVPLSLALAVLVQLACQAFKVVLYSIRDRKLDLRYFLSAGGMPSAHSAFVTALSVADRHGERLRLRPLRRVLRVLPIVIYDSFRLRGAVEKQARALKRCSRGIPRLARGGSRKWSATPPRRSPWASRQAGGLAALVSLLLRQP